MTVSTTANKITYSGNASDTVFPFTFANPSVDDIIVYFTDADGVITDVTASATVTANAAIPPNPTPIGGSVTYPTSGSPIALGTLLTIYRSLDEVQDTSLDNQGVLYQKTIEEALDYLTMTVQQVQELYGRGIVVAVSDDAPLALPPAAQRALMYMAFDADGNPIAAAGGGAATPVSSAMAPVVAAATLALGRTAFGLGNISILNVGAGLQSSGGSVRFLSTPVLDSINQAVVAGFHMTERHASVAITYTCPAISTLFAGFGFYVYAQTAAVTFAIDAGDAFSGMSNGVSFIIPAGTQVYVSTDGTNTWFTRTVQSIGFDSPLNLQINAGVAANALTITIKDRNGNDPSKTSPVLLAFRDPTNTNGNPVIRAITSALSIVVPNGAELGTVDATAARLWLIATDNAGTVVPGVKVCVSGGTTYPIDEGSPASGTAIGTGSDSAGVLYTASATASKSIRILGYIEITEASKGVWATAPAKIQLFGPGIKKPGDRVQLQQSYSGALQTGTTVIPGDNTTPQNTEGDQYFTVTITPQSPANLLRLFGTVTMFNSNGAGVFYAAAIFQDANVNALVTGMDSRATNSVTSTVAFRKYQNAAGVVATTFNLRAGAGAAGTTTINGTAGAGLYNGTLSSGMEVEEIMT